ncbi:unnamed protein product [Staurois parvus]|uniref:Uncharacterized protein n=1 Tax=Staurois parvus TaxID=386267 RepID=A0ABN9ERG7_9NEOB|nr:unnamed protein product [Staurois parvus]
MTSTHDTALLSRNDLTYS